MSRPVRPRPVDINKKLPVIRSSKDLEDDEGAGTRAAQLARLTAEAEIEASNSVPGKKNINEIPTPQFIVVESYEKDYSRTFAQPSSYVRARVRTENSDFVDYDLDDEDDDWLMDFNSEKRMLSPERFESMLYKLEIMDHKARERAIASGVMVGPTAPVQIQLDSAIEFLQSQNSRQMVLQAVYSYWKNKRERWQKPILRRLQPPPPVNDTNPYNVFRPREKAHRLHTRRMQRRENNVQSFEKLRQVRRNLGQAVLLVKSLAKREEKKREIVECEVSLQRAQFKLKHETPHEDDGFTFPGIQYSQKSLSRRNEDMVGHMGSSIEMANGHLRAFPGLNQTSHIPDNIMDGADQTRRDMRRNFEQQRGRLQKRDTHEPVLLFTKRLDTEKLAAAGIVPPPDPVSPNGSAPLYRFHPRMGRGGRIVFDRWNPLEQVPLGIGRHSFPAESLQPLPPRL